MKNFNHLLLLFLLIAGFSIQAQQTLLTHHMTPEEELRRDEIGRDFFPTLPPAGPVRMVAEFEHMQAVLIRYPFGIPLSLIKEMSEDCNVLTIVAGQSQENTVRGQYQSYGVNMDNVEFMHAPSDSYWTRDYGPWFVVNGNHEVGVCNFPYNRPRPNDNDIPIEVAEYLDVELYGMDLIETGGNYMCDGMGIAASSDLVIEENPQLSITQINNKVKNYLGVHTYHLLPDPLGEYIKHIDCWGKFLDVDKVLIGQVPASDPRYSDYEYVADYFEQSISSYGVPYQVFRVFTPGNNQVTPYTNSLILNKKVFVPLTGNSNDQAAIQVYEQAMPGYEVIGVYDGGYGWQNTDALHCRTRGVADIGMLYIYHMPLLGDVHQEDYFTITADIIPYSNEPVYPDSLNVYYSVDGSSYTSAPLFHQEDYTYTASIPSQPVGSEVAYYLHAADESGRRMNHPYIGEPDPHVFNVIYPIPDVTVDPDSLVFADLMQCIEGLSTVVKNETDSNIYLTHITQNGTDPFVWDVIPWPVGSFPHLLEPGDSLVLNVIIGLVTEITTDFLQDTVFIETGHNKSHDVFILVDSALIASNIQEMPQQGLANVSVFPNPANHSTKLSFDMKEPGAVHAALYDMNGRELKSIGLGELPVGEYSFMLQEMFGEMPENGIYFIRLIAGTGSVNKKIIVLE